MDVVRKSGRKKLFTLCLFAGVFSFMLVLHLSNTNLKIVEGSKVIRINVKNIICNVNLQDQRQYPTVPSILNLTTIYYVTPTFPRPEQTPELIRLSHTLMHVPKLHWIVADDQPVCSEEVLRILRKTGLPFTHIASPKPYIYKSKKFPRGVSNRRAAIDWLHSNAKEGVVYFGDDDNTVDLQLFDEIRRTKKVSMFPVGLIGEYGVSTPVVKDGKVVGFFDSWPDSRTFPVDMAGFAVNLQHLSQNASMPYFEGQEEDMFLLSLNLKHHDIEPLADNCSKILVWHTKTVKNRRNTLKVDVEKLRERNYGSFADLFGELQHMSMTYTNPTAGHKAIVTQDGKKRDILDLN